MRWSEAPGEMRELANQEDGGMICAVWWVGALVLAIVFWWFFKRQG